MGSVGYLTQELITDPVFRVKIGVCLHQDLEEYTTKCLRGYYNQKPWMTKEIKVMLRQEVMLLSGVVMGVERYQRGKDIIQEGSSWTISATTTHVRCGKKSITSPSTTPQWSSLHALRTKDSRKPGLVHQTVKASASQWRNMRGGAQWGRLAPGRPPDQMKWEREGPHMMRKPAGQALI